MPRIVLNVSQRYTLYFFNNIPKVPYGNYKTNKMKKIKLIMLLIGVLSFGSIQAQVAPKGKKTLEVKEKYTGEYMQKVFKGDISNGVLSAMRKRIPKKLKKYGFNDVTITEVGKVLVPVSVTTKLGRIAGGNKEVGKAQLKLAKTSGSVENAVDKMFTENVDGDWKFQVNLIDNETKIKYKIRLNLSYKPIYIIKESSEIVNYR